MGSTVGHPPARPCRACPGKCTTPPTLPKSDGSPSRCSLEVTGVCQRLAVGASMRWPRSCIPLRPGLAPPRRQVFFLPVKTMPSFEPAAVNFSGQNIKIFEVIARYIVSVIWRKDRDIGRCDLANRVRGQGRGPWRLRSGRGIPRWPESGEGPRGGLRRDATATAKKHEPFVSRLAVRLCVNNRTIQARQKQTQRTVKES